MQKASGFNLRSFTSFLLVISTFIMSLSGFILYVAPPGRIADWGTWKLILFTKAEWQAFHTIFSYLFFILVIIHLFFINRKTFLTYIKSKLKTGLNRRWEMVAAIIFSVFIFAGALRSWTPFSPVMKFGDKLKESWEGDFTSPPVLHMEKYTLEKLAIEFDSISPTELVKALIENNIKVTGVEKTLKDIASDNKTTPSAIYEILSSKYKQHFIFVTGEVPPDIGKYTVGSTAKSNGKELSDLIQILKDKGIDANGETSLSAIADKLKVTPADVYKMLLEE